MKIYYKIIKTDKTNRYGQKKRIEWIKKEFCCNDLKSNTTIEYDISGSKPVARVSVYEDCNCFWDVKTRCPYCGKKITYKEVKQ